MSDPNQVDPKIQPLENVIREQIQAQHGMISFAQFMQSALYEPALGYYMVNDPIGTDADFITAPEISPIFAACLARQCMQMFEHGVPVRILEFGGGTGRLAVGVIKYLLHMQIQIEQYSILEISPRLRQRQQQLIQSALPQTQYRVNWLDELPTRFQGIMLANEVVDAIPVNLFEINSHGLSERTVKLDSNQFAWGNRLPAPDLAPYLEAIKVQHHLEAPYVSEYHFLTHAWLRSAADSLHQGVLFIIDYGFPAREYYHQQRHQGSLICHHRHRAHDNPFIQIGQQDITAHIDFSALANTALTSNLELAGYTSQAYFLIGNGMEQVIAQLHSGNIKEDMLLQRSAITLSFPHEMGELFKVIAFAKGVACSLNGFSWFDHRHKL